MSEDPLVSAVITASYHTYVYVTPLGKSFFVYETPGTLPLPSIVFDDGYLSLSELGAIFTTRSQLGLVEWFTARDCAGVTHVNSCPGRPNKGVATITFICGGKTLFFTVNFGKDLTFVGDQGVFVCGSTRGSIFSCLSNLFSRQPSSSRVTHYYEDLA